jgi:hypothetical protein
MTDSREREPGDLKPLNKRVYRELDIVRSKVLFAVLRLQDDYPPGATQKRIADCTKLRIERVQRILKELEAAGYVVESRIFGVKDARIVYEVDTLNAISFRDTAIIVLEMLSFPTTDPEGKIEVEEFSSHLLESGMLREFNLTDVIGNDRIRGKIDLLADNGEHIERITARFIKPRLKAKLQLPYLRLIVGDVPLDQLADYDSVDGAELRKGG